MAGTQYLVLLRGINVGGKNIMKMADLRACLEANGFAEVRTYIQSGNVLLFSADSNARLTERLELLLSEQFGYPARVVVRSAEELRRIVVGAPKGFGEDPSYLYDVLFLKDPLTAGSAIRQVTLKEGVDSVFRGPHVLYFARLAERASQSHLSRLVSRAIYQDITIRNWKVTRKLLELMDAATACDSR